MAIFAVKKSPSILNSMARLILHKKASAQLTKFIKMPAKELADRFADKNVVKRAHVFETAQKRLIVII